MGKKITFIGKNALPTDDRNTRILFFFFRSVFSFAVGFFLSLKTANIYIYILFDNPFQEATINRYGAKIVSLYYSIIPLIKQE
jgi:hypothetical protein